MTTEASKLLDSIGRKRLQDALGVGPTAISNAAVKGTLPSSWFLVCQSLADEMGKACPPELFGWKFPDQPLACMAKPKRTRVNGTSKARRSRGISA